MPGKSSDDPITGTPKEVYPFKYFFRPVTQPWLVVVKEAEPELSPEELADAIRDLSPKAYGAVKQMLLEAKYKAESLLRDEAVATEHGRLAYLAGFASYADYVIANYETWRNTPHDQLFPEPAE
jgi:hypothetical protein